MAITKIFAITIALGAGNVHASSHTATGCGSSQKFQQTLTSLSCTSAALTYSSCSTCCVSDTTKCGGNSITCTTSGTFLDSSKAGTAAGADAAAMQTNCCTAQAKCSSGTCPAGKKAITAAATTNCATATCGSADLNTCCVSDTTKCGGNSITCDVGTFLDSSKAGTTAGADAAAMQTNCCTAQAKCSTRTCPAGKKQITDAATTNCTSATCGSVDDNTCCEADTTKCGGNSITCDVGTFLDSSKAGTAAGADAAAMQTNCCTAQAKCSSRTCPAGKKQITAAATTNCTTATCGSVDDNTCCEADTTKCGGNSITCDSGYFQDTTKAGTAAGANTAAMKTNCCTAKATCEAYSSASASGGTTSEASKLQMGATTLVLAMVATVVVSC